MVTDQGIIEGRAHELMRYRRELGSDVKIFADVLVKHAQPLSTSDLVTAIHDTVDRGLADAVIISGSATGHPPDMGQVKLAKEAAGETPVLIGSGADWQNAAKFMKISDGIIVSSSLKRQGKRENPIDPNRVRRFVEMAQ